MEEMGGLMRLMPRTGFLFFVGAMAISALPPLNGFASKWMVYGGLWDLSGSSDFWARLMGPVAAAVLATVGGLAVATFAKAVGVCFLGRPRSEHAEKAHEVTSNMIVPMAVLAGACVIIGLFPGLVLTAISHALPSSLTLPPIRVESPVTLLRLPAYPPMQPLYPIEFLGVVVLAALAIYLVSRALGGGRLAPRSYGIWACGYPRNGSIPENAPPASLSRILGKTQYSSSSFSQPFAYLFRQFFDRRKVVDLAAQRSPYFPEEIRVRILSSSPFENWVYKPVRRIVVRLARRVARIQTGSVQLYLSYMLFTIVLLLLVAK
jgi:hydrogenase-4 component B